MSKRLTIFLPDLVGGGAQRTMLKLAAGIADRGYLVDVVLAKARGPFLLEVPRDVRLIDLGASRTITSLPCLVRYLREELPHAMVSALHHANIIALLARGIARSHTRLIISERNTLSVETQNPMNWQTSQMHHLARFFYPKADLVVAVSEGVAHDLTNVIGLPPDLVRVIYNPVVTPRLKMLAQETTDHPWLKPGQPPTILSVGRLSEQKDYSTLIKAFASVRQQRSVHLIILGEGPQRPELEALVRRLGLEQDVILPGFVANPYPFMKRATLFVLSSRWEGLPGALIEACYCGVPIVATDCPSGPYEILKNGLYGRLIPVGKVPVLAEAILTGINGNIAPPSPESWHPYELDTIVDQYLNILL